MKRALWLFQAFLVLIPTFPIAILPLPLAYKVGEFMGLAFFLAWGSRRRIAIENLERAVSAGGLSITEPAGKLIEENFKNLGRSFVEIVKIYFGTGGGIIRSVKIVNVENLHKAAAKGKGVLLMTGHCGNWELMALAGSAQVKELSVIARPINNPFLNTFVEKIRQRLGNSVIYKEGALRGMLHAFRNGGTVGILLDQSVTPDEGYIIDFLGRGAWTTKMPALIARRFEVPVVPAFIHREGKGHTITIYPEVSLSESADKEEAVIEDMKRLSSHIENYIREHPTEWLWIHRRWKRV
jgi:KDO2-lipid IV(A) lauroyltransferase